MKRCHAKICNLDFGIRSDQDILRFEIAVADVERMAVGDGTDYLAKEVESVWFRKGSTAVDEGEEVAMVDILENEVTGMVRLCIRSMSVRQLTSSTCSPRYRTTS